jgi:hypothetical protein
MLSVARPDSMLAIFRVDPAMEASSTSALLLETVYGPVPPPTANVAVIPIFMVSEAGMVVKSAGAGPAGVAVDTTSATVSFAPLASKMTILAVPGLAAVTVIILRSRAATAIPGALLTTVYGAWPPEI